MRTDDPDTSIRPCLITIAGPTAVGKTALAIEVAERLHTEIISADSRQLYEELCIGVARPEAGELAMVRHHLIADRSVHHPCTAAQYAQEATSALEKLFKQHDHVVCAGGSGLYLKALLEGFDVIPDVPNEIGDQLQLELDTQGLAAMRAQLREHDPDYADAVDLDNPRRVLRALAVWRGTGRPYSSYLGHHRWNPAYDQVNIVLVRDRHELYERINQRVDLMIEQGLIAEAKRLYPYRDQKALQTVGYQELFAHFDGDCSLEHAIDKIKQHSRNYAKRQMTWFRNQGDWHEVMLTGRGVEEVVHDLMNMITATR